MNGLCPSCLKCCVYLVLILLYPSASLTECFPVCLLLCTLICANSFIKTRIQIQLQLPASSTLISDCDAWRGGGMERAANEPSVCEHVYSSFPNHSPPPLSLSLAPPWSDSVIKTSQPPTHTHKYTPPQLFSNLVCCQLVVVGQRQTVDWAVRFSKPIISLEFTQATPAYKLSLSHTHTHNKILQQKPQTALSISVHRNMHPTWNVPSSSLLRLHVSIRNNIFHAKSNTHCIHLSLWVSFTWKVSQSVVESN